MEAEFKQVVSVDIALFTVHKAGLAVLLIRRERDPYQGCFALPGGFVHEDKDADATQTARRVLANKVGIVAQYLEQLYTFSGQVRDPRGWSVSIAYYALMPESLLPAPDDNRILISVDALPELPFDHAKIIAGGVERLRNKSTYSTLPAFLLPKQFTLNELHRIYQQVIGSDIDNSSFRRRIEAQEMVTPVEGSMKKGRQGRPAQVYQLSDTTLRQFRNCLMLME